MAGDLPKKHPATEGTPFSPEEVSRREPDAFREESPYRTLFEACPDAILLLSEGRFRECNPAALALFGADSPEEITGKTPSDLSPPFQPDGTPSEEKEKELFHEAFASGSASFEWRHRKAGGGDFSAEVRLTAVPGGRDSCFVILRDITLKNGQERWIGSLSANLPGVLFRVNRAPSGDEQVFCFGGTMAPLFGCFPGQGPVSPEVFFRHVCREDLPGVNRSLAEAREKKTPWRCGFRLELPDGRRFRAEGTASQSEEPDGSLLWHGYISDVTERKDLEEQLKDQLELQEQIFATIPVPLVLKDGLSRFLQVNEAFADFVNLPRKEILGKGPYEVFGPDLAELVFGEDQEILRTGETKMDLERRVRDGHGRLMWLKSYKGPIRNSRGEAVGIVGGNMDITAVKDAEEALRESEARWKFALEGSGAGVWDLNLRTGEIFFSRQWKALLGYGEEEIENSLEEWKRLVHPDDMEATFRQIEVREGRNGDVCTAEFRMKRKDGEWAWILGRGKVVEWSGDGEPLRMIGTHTDITERKNAEKIIFHQATHDTLTGLANRSLFSDRLDMAVAEAKRCRKKVGVAFLDLDNFKRVNDDMGHAAGDMLLVSVAGRMRTVLRETDTLARLGGDEFTVLFPLVENRDEVETAVERMRETLSDPFTIEGRTFSISGSMGICFFPDDGQDGQLLIKRADMAMYEAKRAGKNTWRNWSGLHCAAEKETHRKKG